MKTIFAVLIGVILFVACPRQIGVDDIAAVNRQYEAQQFELHRREEADKQVTCLARNVYYEARGEPKAGQIAVAEVTLNRVKSHFAPTICDVVYQRGQFEWTQLKKPKYERSRWRLANTIAHNAIAGQLKDTTEGALYFHSTRIDAANWLAHKVPTVQIGNHIFFRKRHPNDPVATEQ